MRTIDFYGMMGTATVINMADINNLLQLVIVILSIIYGIIKIVKEKNDK